MTLLRYLLLMTVTTALCWGAWWTVVMIVTPSQTGFIGLTLFYLSLTLALTGTFAVIGFFIRLVLLKQELVFQKVIIAFRQGVFFALLVLGLLLLQSARVLAWYNVAFLIIGLTVAEFFIISKKPNQYRG